MKSQVQETVKKAIKKKAKTIYLVWIRCGEYSDTSMSVHCACLTKRKAERIAIEVKEKARELYATSQRVEDEDYQKATDAQDEYQKLTGSSYGVDYLEVNVVETLLV